MVVHTLVFKLYSICCAVLCCSRRHHSDSASSESAQYPLDLSYAGGLDLAARLATIMVYLAWSQLQISLDHFNHREYYPDPIICLC